jgi:prefoldin subunit 5
MDTFKKECDGVIKDIQKVINDLSSITEKLAKKLEESGSDASLIQKYTNAQLRIFNKAMSTLK